MHVLPLRDQTNALEDKMDVRERAIMLVQEEEGFEVAADDGAVQVQH